MNTTTHFRNTNKKPDTAIKSVSPLWKAIGFVIAIHELLSFECHMTITLSFLFISSEPTSKKFSCNDKTKRKHFLFLFIPFYFLMASATTCHDRIVTTGFIIFDVAPFRKRPNMAKVTYISKSDLQMTFDP